MLSDKIKELRTANRFSQVELAKKLNVTKQTISNWENNNIQPSIDMLVKVAECFNVSTDYLLCRVQEKTVCVDGLNDRQIVHIRLLIDDLRMKNLSDNQ
ncbi:MAG: helix-turn-helix transcriptional regulator [Clostridia bacterium]|nr:helix-turn-helix transcriptional regulator [Clostridia bacterium]